MFIECIRNLLTSCLICLPTSNWFWYKNDGPIAMSHDRGRAIGGLRFPASNHRPLHQRAGANPQMRPWRSLAGRRRSQARDVTFPWWSPAPSRARHSHFHLLLNLIWNLSIRLFFRFRSCQSIFIYIYVFIDFFCLNIPSIFVGVVTLKVLHRWISTVDASPSVW